MSVAQPLPASAVKPHLHLQGEECPWCEQPIPNEKLEEVSRRIAAKERQRQLEVDARMRAEIDAVRKRGQAALEAAKTEALAQGRKEAEAELRASLNEATEAVRQAVEREGALAAQLAVARAENERASQEAQAAIEAVRSEAAEREVAALEQGRKTAEAALKEQLDQAAEQTAAAKDREEELKAQLVEAGEAQAEIVRTMTVEMEAREQAARAAGTAAAEASHRDHMTAAETARLAAEAKLAEAEAGHEAALNARLQEQREALEKHNETALNAEKARAFGERQKLENAVQDLQRKLEKKSNEELGEGAEVDLFEELQGGVPGRPDHAGCEGICRCRHNSRGEEQWPTVRADRLRCEEPDGMADGVRDQAQSRSGCCGGGSRRAGEPRIPCRNEAGDDRRRCHRG